MNPINILIAEDDAVLRNLYEKKFAIEGFTVRCATDGEEALKMLREQPPSILL
jgi:DNA-binding response OmpR family regulator